MSTRVPSGSAGTVSEPSPPPPSPPLEGLLPSCGIVCDVMWLTLPDL